MGTMAQTKDLLWKTLAKPLRRELGMEQLTAVCAHLEFIQEDTPTDPPKTQDPKAYLLKKKKAILEFLTNEPKNKKKWFDSFPHVYSCDSDGVGVNILKDLSNIDWEICLV